MPAGSESPHELTSEPTLPRRWRPLGVRLAGWIFGVSLLVIVVVSWLAVPESVREATNLAKRLTLLGFAGMGAAALHALMRSRVDATEEGLVVVNGYRRRQLAWQQVVSVSLPHGAPWAVLDLADGTTVSAMAIQGSDGPRAQRALRELRALLDRAVPEE